MIGRVAGILVEKNFSQVVVSCNGVGYEIDVPMSTFYPLPRTGEEVTQMADKKVTPKAPEAAKAEKSDDKKPAARVSLKKMKKMKKL